MIGYGLPDSDTVEVCQVSVSSRHMWQGSLAVKGMQFKVQWYIPDSKRIHLLAYDFFYWHMYPIPKLSQTFL